MFIVTASKEIIKDVEYSSYIQCTEAIIHFALLVHVQ